MRPSLEPTSAAQPISRPTEELAAREADRSLHVLPTLFGAVAGANMLSMSTMSFFELPIGYLLPLYLASALVAGVLLARSGVTFPALSTKEHALCIGVALALSVPRWSYLVEGWLGFSMNPACADDAWHIQNLASLVTTERYPPMSTFDNSKYFSYYYAPYMLGGALSMTGAFSTIKQALGATILVYTVCFIYAVMYASRILFSQRKLQITFAALCLLYGGFDFLHWLLQLDFVPRHSEWWATSAGFGVQFSGMITLLLWVPQHLASALSIAMSAYVVRGSKKPASLVLAGLLCASAVFSSPFVVLGAAPFALWFIFRWDLWKAARVVALVTIACGMPLWWIYTVGALPESQAEFAVFGALSEYWQQRKAFAFLAYLGVVLLELWPLIIASWCGVWRNKWSVWLLAGSLVYLFSTFFFSYFGNYSMRGSIFAILVLLYLATPTIHSWLQSRSPVLLRLAIACYFLGGFLEYASFSTNAWGEIRRSDTPFNAAALRSNADASGTVPADLEEQASHYPMGWYILEKRKTAGKQTATVIDAIHMQADNPDRYTFARTLAYLQRLLEPSS